MYYNVSIALFRIFLIEKLHFSSATLFCKICLQHSLLYKCIIWTRINIWWPYWIRYMFHGRMDGNFQVLKMWSTERNYVRIFSTLIITVVLDWPRYKWTDSFIISVLLHWTTILQSWLISYLPPRDCGPALTARRIHRSQSAVLLTAGKERHFLDLMVSTSATGYEDKQYHFLPL